MKTVSKTAVSIPNSIFKAAEQLSNQLGISRSELYTRAVAAYIKGQHHQSITETLNQIYADEQSEIDPLLQQMQFASLDKEDWW